MVKNILDLDLDKCLQNENSFQTSQAVVTVVCTQARLEARELALAPTWPHPSTLASTPWASIMVRINLIDYISNRYIQKQSMNAQLKATLLFVMKLQTVMTSHQSLLVLLFEFKH